MTLIHRQGNVNNKEFSGGLEFIYELFSFGWKQFPHFVESSGFISSVYVDLDDIVKLLLLGLD